MMLGREFWVAMRFALKAGAALQRCHESLFEGGSKPYGEAATAGDLEADAIIRAGLEAAFPEDVVFSEGTADSPARLSKARVWIVDALDGASNFTERGDEYCVSIGLALEGRPVLGVVYNPARSELYGGCRGFGVTLNGSPVRVSQATHLEGARLTVSRKEWRRGLGTVATTLPILLMASMAYKLARVAAGLDDGVLTAVPRREWGTCAGVALVLAAGGRATLLDGREIVFNRPEPRQPLGMIAAGPRLHSTLLGAVRGLSPTGQGPVDRQGPLPLPQPI